MTKSTKPVADIDVGIPEEFLSTPGNPVSEFVHCAKVFKKINGIKASKTFDRTKFGNFAWVDPSKLRINFRAQRWPEEKHIIKLIGKFDPTLCTPLTCVYYPKTDTYHVSDGQQHGLALLVSYYSAINKGLEIPVWYVMGDEQTENKLVLGLNRDNLPMAKYFIHAAEVKQAKPTALAIEAMCQRAGVVPAYKAKGKKPCITHTTNLYMSYTSLGETATERALTMLVNTFPGEHINSLTMLGLAYIYKQLEMANAYTDELAEDIGLAMSICFKNMDSVHKDIKNWFENQKQNSFEVRNMGRYSSGILKAYEKLTGVVPIEAEFDINPIGMYATYQRQYKKVGGLYA